MDRNSCIVCYGAGYVDGTLQNVSWFSTDRIGSSHVCLFTGGNLIRFYLVYFSVLLHDFRKLNKVY